MSKHGDNLFRRTGKKLSVLVFETTKRSRIMKKRMRISSLQKSLKADYRDLGFVVFDAVSSGRGENLLEEPDVKALIKTISKTQHEIERLREGVARISRARKSFGIPGSLLEIESHGPVPDADGVEIAPVQAPAAKKRRFFGLGNGKREKAIEALREAVAKEKASSGKSGGGKFMGLGRIKDAPSGVETETEDKPRRSFLGLGRKKETAEVEKGRRRFLGLGRKKDVPEPDAGYPPSPPSQGEKPATAAAVKEKPPKSKKVSSPKGAKQPKKAKTKAND